jgi:putative FmdB family regulatory protein
MPLYEYQCDDCGNRFERIQKFSDPPVDKCPTCGGVVRKLISSPAIQFKGSGWYITDYARKGESGGGSPDSGKDSSASKDANGAAKESSAATEAAKETSGPSKAGSSESAKPAAEKATPGSKT